MRISSKSKVAFQVLLDIAAHTANGYAISTPQICRRHKLSHSYLEIIFSSFRSAGIIKSHRGPGGGFSLARKPEEVSLKEVVFITEGQDNIREDLGAGLWAKLDLYMDLQMEKITLAGALNGASIVIETGTKGVHYPRKVLSAKQDLKIPKQNSRSGTPKIMRSRLGPNSVFSFGKYLKSI